MAIDDRLLKVLKSINEIGLCTVLDLHRATGISRPAVHRIVENLCEHGYVERVDNSSRVRLTSRVRELSAGYRDEDWIAETAIPVMTRLQNEIRWPSSLATPEGIQMIVRETTRHRSPFVFDKGRVGYRLPMLKTSLGLAYLAFCDDKTRAITLSLLQKSDSHWDLIARDTDETERRLRLTIARGYSFRKGGHTPGTSSISVPILTDSGAVGSLCVTFASSAISLRHAVEQLLPSLRAAATEISRRVSAP